MSNQVKKHFLAEAEENMLEVWQKEDTFKKSVENRKGGEQFSFYDGPPYANGLPKTIISDLEIQRQIAAILD